MRWEVLSWNTPAIDFYRSLGAEVLSDWLPVRFIGNAFDEFAAK